MPAVFPRTLNLVILFSLLVAFVSNAWALDMSPNPIEGYSRDPLSFSLSREERPSVYWVNIGVPDLFFNGVYQYSGAPDPSVFAIRNIEYALGAKGWCTDQLQVRVSLPFEATTLLDAGGNTHDAQSFGDLEVGASYFFIGKREAGNFIALDGWCRFPTGTNPFKLAFPLLGSGKGAASGGIGLFLGQEVGGFSFFQSIHYEKTDPIYVDSTNALFGSGNFQWPETLHASGRIEFLVFQRAERLVRLFYEFRMKMTGLMTMNGQPVFYGQGHQTDQLFFSTSGLNVRVDKEFTAEGKITFFPFDIPNTRPDVGWLFSLGLEFRPF